MTKREVTSEASVGPAFLRCEYRVNPLGIDIVKPRLSWILDSDRRAQAQSAYQVLVATSEAKLAADEGDAWDSGKVESGRSNQVVYAGQTICRTYQHDDTFRRFFWKVRVWDQDGRASDWSEAAWWEMAFLSQPEWKAKWIGHHAPPAFEDLAVVPYLRKGFEVEAGKPIARARVYATALGLYRLFVNGARVGEDLMTPGWTDYFKRVQYQTYDVTDLVRPGGNAVGVILAPGWFSGRCGFSGTKVYGDRPHALVHLRVEYEDGSVEVVASDETWKASQGAILASDIQAGEAYDARKEMPGWASPGFDDGGWADVDTQQWSTVPLVAQISPTVRETQELKAISVHEAPDGAWVFDLGQNMAGVVRLKVTGPAGTTVRIRQGEVLDPGGTLHTKNLGFAKATDYYTLAGGGEEVYQPSFTYHGFRYVELTGYPGKPDLDAVTGIVFHTDTPPAGEFECSSAMVNQLQSNLVWSQRANSMTIPTDCPQRSERAGWTGDVQIFIRTACFNMDWAAFMTKYMTDMVDAQSAAGAFPDFAPRIPAGWNGDAAPAWGEAGLIVPWTMYLCYGDTRIIEANYHAMERWMEYIHEVNPNYLRQNRTNNNVADWLNDDAYCAWDLFATAYWAIAAGLMARMARVIGRDADADKYERLLANIKAAFAEAYVNAEGRVMGENRGRAPGDVYEQIPGTDTQTAYLLALHLGLAPAGKRGLAEKHLLERIEERGWHLSTGFCGCPLLLGTLTELGHLDLAYRLLLTDTCPSWGYMVNRGATTMWEAWDAWTEQHEAKGETHGSLNHFAFGAVGEWLYQTVAGIDVDPDRPAYKHVIFRPRPGGEMTFAKAAHDSIRGKIVSDWKIENGAFHWRVALPANTTGTVYVPAGDAASVTESGKPASEAEGVRFVAAEDGRAVFEIASGTYVFEAPDVA